DRRRRRQAADARARSRWHRGHHPPRHRRLVRRNLVGRHSGHRPRRQRLATFPGVRSRSNHPAPDLSKRGRRATRAMIGARFRLLWRVLKEAALSFAADKAGTMGAAIAFYTLFSLAPVLVLVIAIAGFVWGDEAARGAVDDQLRGVLGDESARTVQAMVRHASNVQGGLIATALGLVTMMVAATTVFGQMQDALNVIW